MPEDTGGVMERLIGALQENTAALLKSGGKPASGKPASGKPVPDKITAEMVKAALVGVKDAHGKPAALKIIKEAGGCAEMSAIKPARYSAVIAACEEIMGEGGSDEQTEPDDEL